MWQTTFRLLKYQKGGIFLTFAWIILILTQFLVDGKTLINLSHAGSSLPGTTPAIRGAGIITLLSSNTDKPVSITDMISLICSNDHQSDHYEKAKLFTPDFQLHAQKFKVLSIASSQRNLMFLKKLRDLKSCQDQKQNHYFPISLLNFVCILLTLAL